MIGLGPRPRCYSVSLPNDIWIIRRDITTKLYIMHYGYVIQETYMHFFQVDIHINVL